MKKAVSVFLTTLLLVFVFSFSATYAFAGPAYTGEALKGQTLTGSTDNPGGVNKKKDSQPAPVSSDKSRKKISNKELEALYEEFEKFWFVKDKEDFQDRFEEFLETKHIDPDDLEDYDDFIDAVYEDNLDWDYLDRDEFDEDDIDRIYDDDIDDLYDDYLDDYIDEEYYADYGEYFDEVYYD